MGIGTDVIHGGQHPEERTGAVSVPIFQTSTYKQDAIGKHRGYEYARTQNPTREAWERCVCKLEGGTEAVAFSSGLGTTSAILKNLRAGDHVVAGDNMYGGTYRLFETIYRPLGLDFSYVDSTDPAKLRDAMTDRTKMVFIETPTNPMMNVTDIAAAAEIARAKGAFLVVDNTFLTPYFQKPLSLGAHAVMHSATKYLNGHADVVGGIVVTNDQSFAERIRYVQNAEGAVPGPMDCFLALRGVKTLAVRMPRHESNAKKIVELLVSHPKVEKVYYPGLEDHPGYAVARKQCTGFGGMVSFTLSDFGAVQAFATRTKIFTLAESLGGIESLLCHPASMTHASVPKEKRDAMGLTDSLLRLSVGIEDPEDLVEDIRQALSR
ncbi:MAG: PLP-dependent transferase [Candidatus Eisenbacteria bacterium]|uniref:PLP-dependent transferase n=1 Tax=Eiseniibacteriota bacterium TaxID=2212470 RepID=A0A956SGN4_UNCEI|nr:PLP-dependent transferase [Candidatus Eisenbacteria bacterium]MCB9463097.1 PLP-dependent transferase [Candidatus Eisenbacteria bacterium]